MVDYSRRGQTKNTLEYDNLADFYIAIYCTCFAFYHLHRRLYANKSSHEMSTL